MSKIEDSIELIEKAMMQAKRPAAMLSFGKDSMVMAHLMTRTAVKPVFPRTHRFPVDVIYHRDPWFPHKHEFANRVIQTWGMEVHDFPPMAAGVKVKEDMLELVARYNFGHAAMDIPKNTVPPEEYPRRDYLCGLNDWLLRPKMLLEDYVWDTVFVGHRSADVDPFEGHVPLSSHEANVGGVRMIFPLRDWSDDDVWDYVRDNSIPIQVARYEATKEQAWYSNDHVHACTACIDPRETGDAVYCPKLKREVPNRGAEVLQLDARKHVSYIEGGKS